MKLKINNQNSFVRIVEYLFIFTLILNCNTIWTSYEETPINRILKVFLVIITLLYVIANKRITFSSGNSILIFGAIAVIYILIYSIIVRFNIPNFLYFIIDVLCIYIFVIIASENRRGIGLLSKYSDIILIIAIISLVFWLSGSVLGILHPTGYVHSTWTGNNTVKIVSTYYNLYFETQSQYFGTIRNMAIFTEAPMFNFHLCIALLIELFNNKRVSKKRCAILIIAIISTISTTGWCMIIIALLVKYIFDNNISGFWRIIKIIIVPVLLVVGFVLLQTFLLNKLESSSGSIRMDDFIAGYKAWKTHPIFGAGFGNSDYVKHFMSSFRWNNQGFSNSIMHLLYQGGIFLVIPYIWFAYKWIRTCKKKKDIQWLLFFGCFIYLFIVTIVTFRFLTIFIFMASDFIKDRKLDKNYITAKHKNQDIALNNS